MPRTSAVSQTAYVKQERTRRNRAQAEAEDSDLDLFEDTSNHDVLNMLAGQGRSARCYGSDEVLEFN